MEIINLSNVINMFKTLETYYKLSINHTFSSFEEDEIDVLLKYEHTDKFKVLQIPLVEELGLSYVTVKNLIAAIETIFNFAEAFLLKAEVKNEALVLFNHKGIIHNFKLS